jgi:membrane protein YdbS with pleckstrin-like domain
MSAWTIAVIATVSSLLVLAGSDLVSQELRGWLDLAPLGILRLASVQLKAEQRKKVLDEAWIPDLMYVLRGKESRPISRLIRGTWFAVCLLISVLRGRYSYQPGSNPNATPATNEDVQQARGSWQSSGTTTSASGSRQRPRRRMPSQSVNMQPGESLVVTVRKHPVILLGPIFWTFTGLIIAALLSISGLNGISVVLDVIWLAWGVLLLRLAWKIASWSVEYLIVTSRRVILSKGILSRNTETIPVARMTNIALNRSMAARLIGYGELIVASGGNEQFARRVPYIPYPVEVYQELGGAIPP